MSGVAATWAASIFTRRSARAPTRSARRPHSARSGTGTTTGGGPGPVSVTCRRPNGWSGSNRADRRTGRNSCGATSSTRGNTCRWGSSKPSRYVTPRSCPGTTGSRSAGPIPARVSSRSIRRYHPGTTPGCAVPLPTSSIDNRSSTSCTRARRYRRKPCSCSTAPCSRSSMPLPRQVTSYRSRRMSRPRAQSSRRAVTC